MTGCGDHSISDHACHAIRSTDGDARPLGTVASPGPLVVTGAVAQMAEPEEPAAGCSLEEQCEHWKMQAYEQYERFLELEMEHESGGDTAELTERAETAEAELEALDAKYRQTLRSADEAARAKVRPPTPLAVDR